jgi:hypothetical protein
MQAIAVLHKNRNKFALSLGTGAGVAIPGLAAVVSPIIAGGVVLGSLIALTAMMWPFFSVLMTAAVVPLERVGRFTNDGSGVTFSLMRVFGLLGLISLFLHSLISRKKLMITTPVVLYGIYICISFLTLTYTTDFTRGFQWCFTMIGNVLFLFLVINTLRSASDVKLPIILWLATTLAIGIFTVYQWHSGTAVVQGDRFQNSGYRTTEDRFSTVIIDYAEFDRIGAVKRVLGSTSHPAVYGINVILTVPFYFYLLRISPSWWIRAGCFLGLGVASYNVLLTNTRAAIVTLLFTLVCVFFSRLVKHRVAILVAALVACACAAPFLPSDIYQRVLAFKNYSVGQAAALRIRFSYWQAGVDMFSDHWLLGVGSGNQAELPARLKNIRMPPNTSIHNEFFESLLETGLVGYPFIVGFVVVLFRRCLRVTKAAAQRGDREIEYFGVASLIAFVTILVYGLQCDVLHFTLKGWWLAMGLIVGISEMKPQFLSAELKETSA